MQQFISSLNESVCPDGINIYLQAMWYDAKGDWDRAHGIVQSIDNGTAARIHAYLHRKEGDDWNSKYWHRIAGSVFPADKSLQEEWDMIVRQLFEIV